MIFLAFYRPLSTCNYVYVQLKHECMNILYLLITLRTRLEENYGHKIKLN